MTLTRVAGGWEFLAYVENSPGRTFDVFSEGRCSFPRAVSITDPTGDLCNEINNGNAVNNPLTVNDMYIPSNSSIFGNGAYGGTATFNVCPNAA